MPDDSKLAAMREHYDRGSELGRLTESFGRLEFERTKEIILRQLPPPPAVVADIGGGPGRYTLWLAQLGYQVAHRDLIPLHVEQLRQAAGGNPRIETAVGDVRQLDLASERAGAVCYRARVKSHGREIAARVFERKGDAVACPSDRHSCPGHTALHPRVRRG
jgi:SAM-dependent methyltransferase